MLQRLAFLSIFLKSEEVNHDIIIGSSGIYILNIIISYYMIGLMCTVWFITIADKTAKYLLSRQK